LNINNPVKFNEKIQWYKLNYRNSLLHNCVDKWEVRKYVERKGLSDILIPASGPYNDISEINTESLPAQFILKLTNGSGFNQICFDKNKFDFNKSKNKFDKWKKINFFDSRREWAYKNVHNRIMCESLIIDESMSLPSDYRFFCFFGEVKLIAVDLESIKNGQKTSNYYRHLFTPQWEIVNANIQYPSKPNFTLQKPSNLKEMLAIAETLSEDFPFVRVDIYNSDGKILFGELTFYHASGYQEITPAQFEAKMGRWFDLTRILK
jgi:hypothetical protein